MNINAGNLYAEFRADGWPLCPQCGEDELFSDVMLGWNGEGDRPTVDDCINSEMACHRCNWNSWRERLTSGLEAANKRIGELENYLKWLCSVPPPARNK